MRILQWRPQLLSLLVRVNPRRPVPWMILRQALDRAAVVISRDCVPIVSRCAQKRGEKSLMFCYECNLDPNHIRYALKLHIVVTIYE